MEDSIIFPGVHQNIEFIVFGVLRALQELKKNTYIEYPNPVHTMTCSIPG